MLKIADFVGGEYAYEKVLYETRKLSKERDIKSEKLCTVMKFKELQERCLPDNLHLLTEENFDKALYEDYKYYEKFLSIMEYLVRTRGGRSFDRS